MVVERDDCAMTLIDHARPTLDFAQPRDVALVRPYAIAIRLEDVGRLRQRVTERGEHARIAAIADLRLQSVIIPDAEVHYRVDLAYAARFRQDWTGEIGGGHGSDLSRRRAIKHR